MDIITALSEFCYLIGLNRFSFTFVLLVSFPIIFAITALFFSESTRTKTASSKLIDPRSNAALILTSIIVTTAIMFYFRYLIFGINVSESSTDTFHILQYGSWTQSYKDPFYNLIDVWSVLDSSFGLLSGNLNAQSLTIEAPIYLAVVFGNFMMLYCVSKRMFSRIGIRAEFLLVILLVFSSPQIEITGQIGLSILLSLISLYAIIKYVETQKRNDLIALMICYVTATLSHTDASSLIIVCSVWLFLLVFKKDPLSTRDRTSIMRVLTVLVGLTGLIYSSQSILTGAFRNYAMSIILFLTAGSSGRIVLYSASAVPRIVAISYSFLPAIAVAPLPFLIWQIFIRKNNQQNLGLQYYAILSTAAILVIAGFVSSSFQGSLSREFGDTGFALLGIPVAFAINRITSSRLSRISRFAFVTFVIFGVMIGVFAPPNIPTAPEYQSLTKDLRSPFVQYYMTASTIATYWNGSTKITVYSADNLPLGYSLLVSHPQLTPDEWREILSKQTYNINADNLATSSIVFSSGFVVVGVPN